jgi:HK97 family phage portal protein
MKAAAAAFRGKSATTTDLNNLYKFLGIDPKSEGGATSEATYFACLKVLSESIGKLPLKIQQYTPDKGIRIAREHRFYRMLNERPNRYMTASVFWSTMELYRNHYGNAYAWIDTRDPRNPQLWLMDPDSVEVWYDNARKLSDVPDVYYRYTTPTTPEGVIVLGSEEVLHFKSHYTVDGLVGISVRDHLASTIQGNIKAQDFINKTIRSGMTAKSVLNYTGSLNDKSVQTLLAEVTKYAKGEMRDKGIENIIPMPVGFSLSPLNLKLADSQFLELRQYSALQIASAFGVKPYQVGDYTKSSYASAEAQQLSFLVDTLLYIIKQDEEEIAYKLLNTEEETNGYHAKFNTGVMLRADQKTQIDTLSTAVSNFLLTPNEARERLDLPAKEGGDQLLGNGASIPVQYTGAQYTNITAREEEKEWLKKTLKELLTASQG